MTWIGKAERRDQHITVSTDGRSVELYRLHQQRRVHRPTRRWTSQSPQPNQDEISWCTWRNANRKDGTSLEDVATTAKFAQTASERTYEIWGLLVHSDLVDNNYVEEGLMDVEKTESESTDIFAAVLVHNAAKPGGRVAREGQGRLWARVGPASA